ncbi:MAG: hypothetical protein HN952_03890 [Candidatus Cloacimonetes bacterium]|jgi:methylphosphotriester-DNA--protein-cysteine methyltransferase|nr:hypothetical protein [Candidatus Cloacimonadota bacterium]MBT6994078.1 hypothetical protein [Candidatus Cloacimonadota bacterium]MBT7469595.1 hypothetical protein [Candidatus Cloacimonadota bacterium]
MKKRYLLLIIILVLALLLWFGCSHNRKINIQKKYVGSVNSDIYHYPHCKSAKRICISNEVWFSSKNEARKNGYRACKLCFP